MKEFAIYTGLRAALFAVCLAVLWVVLHGALSIWPIALLALIISSILSIYVLRAARDRLASQIETRAERISHRIEQARTAEDDD
jgi:membrane protein implicated in regulation of membrane protease activity